PIYFCRILKKIGVMQINHCFHIYSFCILFLILGQPAAQAQAEDLGIFAFGHSLIDHRPPRVQTPSDETTIFHWMSLLAEADDKNFSAGGKYGFLPQHAMLPPFSQWAYDIVDPVWESDEESFADSKISTVLITAGNFMQWQGPGEEYPSDPGVTPISATETIVDWVLDQDPEYRIYIYENWPDMSPFLSNGFPPDRTELDAYADYTRGDFHEWWIQYQDALLQSRPAAEVRMIPVGPILHEIFDAFVPRDVDLQEFYEDDAPHGRASLYFMAAMISYSAICQKPLPGNFNPPTIIHSSIRDNYAGIAQLIWEELMDFNDATGKSRVFFQTTSSEDIHHGIELTLFPNPTNGMISIVNERPEINLRVYDQSGHLRLERDLASGRTALQLPLSSGVYLLEFSDEQTGFVKSEKLMVR
ncbi:MAG TPA: T9SS type A sorting domain-containing protein, partial [Saprospiraceae bacterium]|nr:T9SS type A sorting domain-containing protein [Saprospiraceae bacterium]